MCYWNFWSGYTTCTCIWMKVTAVQQKRFQTIKWSCQGLVIVWSSLILLLYFIHLCMQYLRSHSYMYIHTVHVTAKNCNFSTISGNSYIHTCAHTHMHTHMHTTHMLTHLIYTHAYTRTNTRPAWSCIRNCCEVNSIHNTVAFQLYKLISSLIAHGRNQAVVPLL